MDSDIITSAQNPTVKHLKKLLSSSKYRREENLAVAEGSHLVGSFLQSGQTPELIACAESALHNEEIIELLRQLKAASISILVLKDSLFESLSQIHSSVGILMVFKPIRHVVHEKLSGDSLLLEDIQDPGNLGTILRTAAGAGVKSVYLSSGSASPWSPKSLRAGMGAQFGLKIHESANLISLVTGSSVPVMATYLGGTTSLYETDLTQKTAWVFGNEGQGVSRQLLMACSDRIKIPQDRTSVESLNVSAAVAICLFEQVRQRI